MGKYKKSQILILSLIAALLFVTPFLSSSVRSTHLYFIINILILALGAEAGLLSAFPMPPDQEKKPVAVVAAPKPALASAVSTAKNGSVVNIATTTTTIDDNTSTAKIATTLNDEGVASRVSVVKGSTLEKTTIDAAKSPGKVNKCSSSSPSIFFISSGEVEGEEAFKDEDKEGGRAGKQVEEIGYVEDTLTEQELSTKAETFISNFYKQLRMQSEQS